MFGEMDLTDFELPTLGLSSPASALKTTALTTPPWYDVSRRLAAGTGVRYLPYAK